MRSTRLSPTASNYPRAVDGVDPACKRALYLDVRHLIGWLHPQESRYDSAFFQREDVKMDKVEGTRPPDIPWYWGQQRENLISRCFCRVHRRGTVKVLRRSACAASRSAGLSGAVIVARRASLYPLEKMVDQCLWRRFKLSRPITPFRRAIIDRHQRTRERLL